jgi:hypothetical protein
MGSTLKAARKGIESLLESTVVPRDYVSSRLIASTRLTSTLRFIDLEDPRTLRLLQSSEFKATVLNLRYRSLAYADLQGADRRLTQALSRFIYELVDEKGRPAFAGLRYASRFNPEWKLWAVFHRRFVRGPDVSRPLIGDPALVEALRFLNLQLEIDDPRVVPPGTEAGGSPGEGQAESIESGDSDLKEISSPLDSQPGTPSETRPPAVVSTFDTEGADEGTTEGPLDEAGTGNAAFDTLFNEGTEAGEDSPVQPLSRTSQAEDSSDADVEPTFASLPSFSADIAAGEDLIGIKQDVEAFAKLIASRTVTPPLSIGLFGDWGSGKSFFMQQLRAEVDKIATAACKKGKLQSQIAFYKRIVQIDFNAWQYMEGNLWASLVDHIFRNLRVTGDKKSDLEALQKKLLENLQTTMEAERVADIRLKEATAKLQTAEVAATKARKDFNAASEQLSQLSAVDVVKAVFSDETVQMRIKELQSNLGLGKLGTKVEDLKSALNEAEVVLTRSNALLIPMVQDPNGMGRLAWIIVILIGSVLTALLLGWLASLVGEQWFAQLVTVLGSITAFLGSAAVWVRKQGKWLSDRITEVQSIKGRVEMLTEKRQSENSKALVDAEAKLGVAKAELLASEQAKREAAEQVIQAKTAKAEATPTRLLVEFIQQRVESSDYRKHLGVLAMIREDFRSLSTYIDAENEKLLTAFSKIEDERSDEPSRINRIILYIDDLDRCPPEKVIEVLQAVHLLLGLSLFVVVVSVDVRWVEYSLRLAYGRLLGGNPPDRDGQKEVPQGDQAFAGADLPAGATPRDYLEKIFQIPFWISPLGTESRRLLLRGLLQRELLQDSGSPEVPRPPATQALRIDEATEDSLEDKISEDVDSAAQGPAIQPINEDASSPGPNEASPGPAGAEVEIQPGLEEPDIDLNPSVLKSYPRELEFMERLAPILGHSPRALKRFVNIYRLIKASLPDEERDEFIIYEGSRGEYKTVLFLLALITSRPDVGLEVFRAAMAAIASSPPPSLASLNLGPSINLSIDVRPRIKYVVERERAVRNSPNARPKPDFLSDPDFERVLTFMETYSTDLGMNAQRLELWIRRVARYSFVLESDLID